MVAGAHGGLEALEQLGGAGRRRPRAVPEQGGSLADPIALGEPGAQPVDARDVQLGVAPLAAVGAARLQDAVALLPLPQCVWRDAGAPRECRNVQFFDPNLVLLPHLRRQKKRFDNTAPISAWKGRRGAARGVRASCAGTRSAHPSLAPRLLPRRLPFPPRRGRAWRRAAVRLRGAPLRSGGPRSTSTGRSSAATSRGEPTGWPRARMRGSRSRTCAVSPRRRSSRARMRGPRRARTPRSSTACCCRSSSRPPRAAAASTGRTPPSSAPTPSSRSRCSAASTRTRRSRRSSGSRSAPRSSSATASACARPRPGSSRRTGPRRAASCPSTSGASRTVCACSSSSGRCRPGAGRPRTPRASWRTR